MTETVELPPSSGTIYERMVSIIEELPAIGKNQRNQEQNFMFRGYDDVMNALNPLLAKHGVFVVPDVIERVTGERRTARDKTMYEVNLHVRFTFFGAGGDSFVASGWGEGTDMGDKATNKAMTGAFKYVLFQTFAIATAEQMDADAGSAEETTRGRVTGDAIRAQTREFDPSRDLLPGAIEVKTVEDADAIRQAQRDAWDEDWVALDEYLSLHTYGKAVALLSRQETAQWWKRHANAIVKLGEITGGGDFPPPTAEQVATAYAWAFNGVALALSEPVTPPDGEPGTATPAGEES